MSALAPAVVNVIAQHIFQFLGKFQKFYTKNEQTLSIMSNILWLQFINFAFIPIVTQFYLRVRPLHAFGLLNGLYPDFNYDWYQEVGAVLCYTMLINCFTPHLSKLAKPIIKFLLRFWDRSFSFKMEKDNKVNTKKVLQQDLNNLYTGDEIASFDLYAQSMTSFLVITTYSAGLPMLYPIGCLNFFIIYWVYKTLLVKYYQKTISFNQDLPIYSVRYFKYAIYFHIVMAAFMYTNKGMLYSDTL